MPAKYHDRFEEGAYYHIYNRSINQEIIFRNDRNYIFFLGKWKKYLHDYVDVFAYCLQPDHFHFFVYVKELNLDDVNSFLEQQFKKMFSSYVLAFNAENNRKGSLLQKRFKRTKVDNPDYFTSIIRYIHNNPIHHHLVANYEDWKYSSYNAMISNKQTLIRKQEVLDWFGGLKFFLEFHKSNVVYNKNAFFDE